MAKRDTYRNRDIVAECTDCDAYWDSANAQALGAKHSYKTGHRVFVDVYIYIQYGPYDENGELIEDEK